MGKDVEEKWDPDHSLLSFLSEVFPVINEKQAEYLSMLIHYNGLKIKGLFYYETMFPNEQFQIFLTMRRVGYVMDLFCKQCCSNYKVPDKYIEEPLYYWYFEKIPMPEGQQIEKRTMNELKSKIEKHPDFLGWEDDVF